MIHPVLKGWEWITFQKCLSIFIDDRKKWMWLVQTRALISVPRIREEESHHMGSYNCDQMLDFNVVIVLFNHYHIPHITTYKFSCSTVMKVNLEITVNLQAQKGNEFFFLLFGYHWTLSKSFTFSVWKQIFLPRLVAAIMLTGQGKGERRLCQMTCSYHAFSTLLMKGTSPVLDDNLSQNLEFRIIFFFFLGGGECVGVFLKEHLSASMSVCLKQE